MTGGINMSRKCYVTGLGTVAGNNRPHSLKASRRTWKANLQKVRIIFLAESFPESVAVK